MQSVGELNMYTGLEIRGCRELRAPLNVLAAPSNFCREPKYVLFDIQKTFFEAYEDAIGLPGKILISSPGIYMQLVE